jgi:hypothetical protein
MKYLIITASLLVAPLAHAAGKDIKCTTIGGLATCVHADGSPVNYFAHDARAPQCMAGKQAAFGLPACDK